MDFRLVRGGLALLLGLACMTTILAQTPGRAPVDKAPPARVGVGLSLDLGALFGLLGQALRSAEAEPSHVPGQVLLLSERTSLPAASELLSLPGITEAIPWSLEALGVTLWSLRVEPGREAELARELETRFPGAIADQPAWLDPQLAPAKPRLYAVQAIAQPPLEPGRRPRLGVIDGAPGELPPLAGRLQVVRFDGQTEADGHAAAVLCVLACAPMPESGFRGLLPDPDITLVAIMERTRSGRLRGSTLGLARALDHLLGQKIPVVNLSLGGAGDRVQRWLVERVLARGVLLVAAAGNGGPQAAPVYPAAWPGVLAVAAHDAAGRPFEQGNRGDYILLAAPGVELWLPLGAQGVYRSGTSLAAPFLSARLAWAASQGERLDAEGLCRRARDLGPPGRDPQTGCGALRW